MESKEAEDKLKQIKARTKCNACHKKGHWKGDPECEKTRSPTGGSSTLQRGGRGGGRGGRSFHGRPGGFLRRAGFAMATA
eukprot:2996439-Pyramimonas_sp.AAC.1